MSVSWRKIIYCSIAALYLWPAIALSHTKPLTLEDAWQRASQKNPLLQQFRSGIDAAQGQVLQAKLYPNPRVTGIVENVGGSGQYNNFNQAQSTVLLDQPLEWPAKRAARKSVAFNSLNEASLNYHAERAALFAIVAERFITVIETQSKVNLAKQGVALSRKTVATIKRRVNAGRSSELELRSAAIALADNQNQLTLANAEWHSAREALASLWAGQANDISTAVIKNKQESHLPSWQTLSQQIKHNPQLLAVDKRADVARAKIVFAHAQALPDITPGIGVQHFNSPSDNAMIAEVSVPIPIFDRNQGNIEQTTAQYNQSLDEIQNVTLNLQNRLFAVYQTAKQASSQVALLKKTILPQAQRALQLAMDGYKQGRFSYLDLLNAQQNLLAEQFHYVESLATYRKAWFQLMVLTGNLPMGEQG